ncbi:MAG: SDR family oxidoreductase [Chthoniobacterales bacterium]|jgi:dTDP-4-dehydrorhamnose reductase
MKVLLFGSGGLLGRYLAAEFSRPDHRLVALAHSAADITDPERLDELFGDSWDVVINAAAVCDFDACERDPLATARVNHAAPLDLARRCASQNAVFVQYSSDYIFEGSGHRPLVEEDEPSPLSVYGRQKSEIEKLVPALCPRSLVLRLSWLYGLGGKTFMSRLPDLLGAQHSLRTAAGKKGSCLYAGDGALWTRRLVEAGQTGLFNLVNGGETSWEEFARNCRQQMESCGLPVACKNIEEVPYEEMGPGWRKRPRYSCLDIRKLSAVLPPGPRPWREALGDFLAEWKSVAAPQTV